MTKPENAPLPCGCGKKRGEPLKFCPLHGAAQELLDAAERATVALSFARSLATNDDFNFDGVKLALEEAIHNARKL